MRFLEATAEIEIASSIDAVFAFAAQIEHLDRWVEGVSEPRTTSGGALGAGSTYASKYTYARRTHEVEYEVTAFDPPRAMAVRAASGPFPFEGRLELAEKGGGGAATRVRNTIRAGSDGRMTSISFVLGGPLPRVMMRRRLRKELERLGEAVAAAEAG
jgi:uncharacterized protein YndB with AHSA1/START domain